jgi:hypothetical protein
MVIPAHDSGRSSPHIYLAMQEIHPRKSSSRDATAGL